MRHERDWQNYHGGGGNLGDYDEATVYPYYNRSGALLYEKVRYKLKLELEPNEKRRSKTFRWRHEQQVEVASGEWRPETMLGRGDAPLVLYRLPELMKEGPERPRYVMEGEKDVHSLLALLPDAVVTTAPSTKEWPEDCTDLFKGADVVIVPDNDAVGQRYCDVVALALVGVARSVRVLNLFRQDDEEGADFTDWVEQRVGRPVQDWKVGLGWTSTERKQFFTAREQALQAFRDLSERAPSWRITLDPKDPRPSARALVSLRCTDPDGHRTVHRHLGAFYRYTGSHYRDVGDEEVKAQIWEFLEGARRIYGEDRRGPFKPTTTTVNDVFNALISVCGLDATVSAPAWLDCHGRPPVTEFMAVGNGLLHLPTGAIHPPTPAFFGLSASEVAFDPEASEPTAWLKFLSNLWEDDQKAISTIQEWFGYCLSTDTRQQKMLLVIGPKRSGKGTLARVQTALLGRASVASPTLASLAQEFGLQPLIGRPLAIISDARLSGRVDQSLVVERLLSISGEDDVSVNRKYRDHWTGHLPTRFMVLTNEVPRFTDASGALPSRFITLALNKSFYGEEDQGLTDRLLGELPSILNWALVGYRRLCERGHFLQPESGVELMDAMESLASPVKAFVSERCDVRPGAQATIDDVYFAWRGWCDENGRREPGTKQVFGRDLQASVQGIVVRQVTKDGKKVRVYEGLEMKPVQGKVDDTTIPM